MAFSCFSSEVKAEMASVIFEMSLRVYDFEPPPLDMVAEA